MLKIKRNAARCRLCNSIIESVSRHDFKVCACESIFVDGGKDYLRRGVMRPSTDLTDTLYMLVIEDLSETEEEAE